MVTEATRYEPQTRTYLNRAMEKNKMNKVTWESLFKMNAATLHHNISIPQFVRVDAKLDELYF